MENKFAEVPDALWSQVEALLPSLPPGPRRGRPPIPDRTILSGIVYRLRTGSQWKALPDQFGSGSACHARYQTWCEAGLFRRLFEKLVEFYDDVCGIEWEWASLDSAMVKAPKGGDSTGPNPTDRGKSGVKRHILTDGRGVPLAAEITAANVHDKRAAVRRSTPSWCTHLAVRADRRICASTRATTSSTWNARSDHVESGHTFEDAARSREAADAVERGGGSSSGPTPGTTSFAPCSFAGSEKVPTTWRSSISRAP